MYVFVTYAAQGMKGVQIRGIRIANYLPKNQVFFINCGDDGWLAQTGFKYKNIPNQIYLPGQIQLPKNTKKLIFADFPTNLSFQIALLLEAKRKNIPCIVIDNIYKKNQFEEKIWRIARTSADMLLLNGLSYLESVNDRNVKIVPPLLPYPDQVLQKKIIATFGLKHSKIILATGYNPNVFLELQKLTQKLSKKRKDFKTVIVGVGGIKKPKIGRNFILLPFFSSDVEMSTWLSICHLFVCKFGYLQVIEALAFQKPVIGIGLEEGFKPKWIDKKLFNVIIRYPKVDDFLVRKITSLLYDVKLRESLIQKIKKLHNGTLDGAKMAAQVIKQTKPLAKKIPKEIIIALDDEKSINTLKKVCQKKDFILPIILAIPSFSKTEKNWWLYDERRGKKIIDKIIDTNFRFLYQCSFHSLHSLGLVLGWYDYLFFNIKKILYQSDKIWVIGSKLKFILTPLFDTMIMKKIKQIK